MCGICGQFNFDRQGAVDPTVVESMNRRIFHRGPDDEGLYLDGNVALAMRRLSIIDLSTGQQPASNENNTVWLVYNGEIYNHQELRARMEERGHRYRSRSDTESIVHLYEEYGADCVQHLRGMFAFALWDSGRRRLFCARDRLGIKPFYYYRDGNRLLFASEIKSLLEAPGVPAELNQAALPEYLAFGYLSGEETLFRGICKLMPGHTLTATEDGQIRIEQYWDLSLEPEGAELSEADCVRTYRELLEQTVESHLMSDVPLGMFLSGGVDSSAVAALAQKIRKGPIQTFAVGYMETPYSELGYARAVADHLGTHHREVRVSAEEFYRALPRLIWHEDEPLAWPSSVALYFVSRLAREHVKVVLTGEGSDETLGGYTRYPWTLWQTRIDRVYRTAVPGFARRRLAGFAAESAWLSAPLRRKLQHTFLGRDGQSMESFYFDNFYSAFSEADQHRLLLPEGQGAPGAAYRNTLAPWERSQGPMLTRLLYTDIKTYLVELLMKQDNMSMATSIESRVPFLDHKLVEFALQIPARFKTRGLAGKRTLKRAVEDLLPRSIIYRKKMGFPTPWQSWLAGPLLREVEQVLLDKRSLARGYFQAGALQTIFRQHRAQQVDHSDRIWRLLNLELWQRVFLDRDPAWRTWETEEAPPRPVTV